MGWHTDMIDALERHDPTALDDLETPTLVNLYTLLSDVQRNASSLRQDVSHAHWPTFHIYLCMSNPSARLQF